MLASVGTLPTGDRGSRTVTGSGIRVSRGAGIAQLREAREGLLVSCLGVDAEKVPRSR